MQVKTTRRDFLASLAATAAVPLMAQADESPLISCKTIESSQVIGRITSFRSHYTYGGDIIDSCLEMLNQMETFTDGDFNPRSSECTLRLPAFGFDYPPFYLDQILVTDRGGPTSLLSCIKGLNPNMHIEYYDGEADIAKLSYRDSQNREWGMLSIAVPEIAFPETNGTVA